MNEKNLATLRQIVIKQREVCRHYIDTYGKDHAITKQSLSTLGKLIYLLARAKRRCEV